MSKQIKNFVIQEMVNVGWISRTEFGQYYNNKNKNFRKLKFMVNGWEVPTEMKNKLIENVRNFLNENNIQFLDIGFSVGDSHRGDYDYFWIKVSL